MGRAAAAVPQAPAPVLTGSGCCSWEFRASASAAEAIRDAQSSLRASKRAFSNFDPITCTGRKILVETYSKQGKLVSRLPSFVKSLMQNTEAWGSCRMQEYVADSLGTTSYLSTLSRTAG